MRRYFDTAGVSIYGGLGCILIAIIFLALVLYGGSALFHQLIFWITGR